MKIFVNSRIFQEKYSGVQNYILNLYENILRMDQRNEYIFLQTKNNKVIGKTKIFRNVFGLFGIFGFDNFLVNFLVDNNQKVIFHGPSFTLPIFKIKKCKYVVTVHDLAFKVFPEHYNKLFLYYINFCLRNSFKKADNIIVVSKNTKKDILKYYPFVPSNKIKVIHLGVSEEFFQENQEKRLINERYFFSITTHPKRKNIYSILEIISKNKAFFKNYKYVIAGIFSQENEKEFNDKIKSLKIKNYVILFGYANVEELKSLYKYADFFIYPSFYEGFGLPILEAMSCGCLVINSNNSSLIEVNPNKDFLFNALDLEDIFTKIKLVLSLNNSVKESIIKKNKKFVRKFSWEKTAKETLKIFNSL